MKPGSSNQDRSNDAAKEASSPSKGTESITVPLKTLAVLNWLGDTGIDGVEERFNQVLEDTLVVETEQVTIGYADRETVSSQFRADDQAGARVPLSKPLKGNMLVVFPMDSANKAAALMLQRAVDDLSTVSPAMGQDALTELCNIMVNGFVDQWATVFETSIDTGSPIAVQDPEQNLIQRILKYDELGFYITSHLRIVDYNIEGMIYVFPGDDHFITKLSQVDLDVIT